MKHFIKSAFILIFIAPILAENCKAGLILENNKAISRPKIKKPITKAIKKTRVKNAIELGPKLPKRQWHSLNGNLNGNDVFLYVRKNKYRQITGYLFDNGGSTQYIYGEWNKDYLQIYDQSNQLLTVILNN
tara:strand:- start:4059 stop:4451 length:393 start_codon:yes stop_codon:yes gene_type:complete